jgi:hypothetical protein
MAKMTSRYEFSAKCNTDMGESMYAQRDCSAAVQLVAVAQGGGEIAVYLSDTDAKDLADYILGVLAEREGREEDELVFDDEAKPDESETPRDTEIEARCDVDETDRIEIEENTDQSSLPGFYINTVTSGDIGPVYLCHEDSCRLRDFLTRSLAEREAAETETETKDGTPCSNETSKTGSSDTPTLSDTFVLNSVLTALTAFQTELSSLLKASSSSNSNDQEEF